MSAEQNKRMVRRLFEEGMNQQNDSTLEELLPEEFVTRSFPGEPRGPEGFKQVVHMFTGAFPDFHITLHDLIADDHHVAVRGTATGTHQAGFMGIPATGNRFEVGFIDIWRVKDGRFVENWVVIDQLTMMQQLGVIPVPEASAV